MNQKYNTENLKEKFSEIHHNFYNYDKMIYCGYKNKITVTCPEHGDFEISISKHLIGQGCPKCRYTKSSAALRRPIETVIEKFKSVHGDKYDYSLITEYKNTNEKLPIICKEHGVFYQSYNNHYNGKQGCPVCGRYKCSEHQKLTTEEFINKAKSVHGDKYDYSKTNYTLSQNNVIIICPEHGEFSQIARNHLFGAGCPKCFLDKSKIERDILDFIVGLVGVENVVENDRTILNGKEIDIYVPKYKIGFEINGLIWHSEKFDNNPNVHLEKTILASEKGIHLIHIFEDDWQYKQYIVKSRIKNLFNKSDNVIHARKCIVKEVPYYESELFLNQHHIQGNCVSKYRYGLYYNDDLVALMTFSKPRRNVSRSILTNENEFELTRFCNKTNYNVVGGASKLFKHFIETIKPKNVISYADRCWSNGELYEKLGFIKYNESKPSYSYVVGKKRVNRFNLRKDVLIKKYGCLKEMTEHEFCLSKEWYRIYDCGCLCYIFNNY